MRRFLLVALFVLPACGGSSPVAPVPTAPTTPTPVSTGFSGAWLVTYKWTSCAWDRDCIPLLMIGTTRGFALRVVQAGTYATGLYQENGMSVDIQGAVGPDGALVMSGYAPPVSAAGASFTVTNLTLRHAADGSLRGSVSWEQPAPPAQAAVSLGFKVSGDIVSATPTDLGSLR